jgi:hypothetical protein
MREEHGQALCAEIPRELSEGLGLRVGEPAVEDLRKLRVFGERVPGAPFFRFPAEIRIPQGPADPFQTI